MLNFLGALPSAVVIGTVLLLGCVGEIITEKVGHLNLGIPGIMCFGTFGGAMGANMVMSFSSGTPNYFLLIFFTLFFSMLMGAFAGLIYAFLTVTLQSNQNVVGLALTTFGTGMCELFMSKYQRSVLSQAAKVIRLSLPFAEKMGDFGEIVLGHGLFVYLAIAIAIICGIFLVKTRTGLSLRAVGENPATADAAGINVSAYKYGAILTGSAIAGFGGALYLMEYASGAWENTTAILSFGWLAIALVIFTVWRPSIAIFGSILFGFLYVCPNFISNIGFLEMKLFKILPYAVTIVVLIITSIVGKKSVQPPAALGLSYFREDR